MSRAYLTTGLSVSLLLHGTIAAVYLWTPWKVPQPPEGSPLELSLSMLQTMATAPVVAEEQAEPSQTPSEIPDQAPEPDTTGQIEKQTESPQPQPQKIDKEGPKPRKAKQAQAAPPPPKPRQQAKTTQEAAPAPAEKTVAAPDRPSESPQASSGQLSGQQTSILLKYKQALVAAIERNKFYPRRAQRRRLEGTAIVVFFIDLSGEISDIRIRQGSGHKLLDETSLTAIRRIGRFHPLPESLGRSRIEFSVPLSYELKTSSLR